MIEPLSALATIGAVGFGMLVGRAMQPRPKPDPGPVCTCGHGYGQHEQGGQCRAEIRRECNWTFGGRPMCWEYTPCPCVKHDGPVPLPEVWSP